MGAFVRWLGRGVVGMLAIFGALVMALLVWFFGVFSDPVPTKKGEKSQAVGAVVPAAAPLPGGGLNGHESAAPGGVIDAGAVAPVDAVGGACDCLSGARCVGPRGGRYCLDPAGKKKYIPEK